MSTILLVDHDPLQASLRKSLLERRFSDVRRVSDAAEALCLVEQPQFASRLGLIVAGGQVPGLGGPAFVAELHTRLPQLPILVLGSENEAESDYIYVSQCIRFLPRPFASEEMLVAAHQMIIPSECKTPA
jgi:CheY-like chemotaxis protein